VNFCFCAVYMANNFDTPETAPPEGLAGPEKDKWEESITKEAMNSISRNSCKKVRKKVPQQMKREIMKTKMIFRKKHEANREIHSKTIMCSKGLLRTPGADFKESFSLVATQTSVRVVLCTYFYYADIHDGLVHEIEAIGIKAAFLEGDITIPTFIEFPEGLEDLRFLLPGESKEYCIQLLKSVYGNVDAALKFFKTYVKRLTEKN
jgi:hypothetical protein